jgi:tRNA threonylcarbamoyladenosine biosynthesis protein TsaE
MRSTSIEDTEKIASDILDQITLSHAARVVELHGNLGSGKTAFVKGLAKALGVTETVTSPTFVIQKTYKTSHSTFRKLVHIDAYRLESADELKKLSWEETVADPHTLIAIEWPERVRDIIPLECMKIHFLFIDDTTREISY